MAVWSDLPESAFLDWPSGLERVFFCQAAQAFGDAVTVEILVLENVVSCVVGSHPVRERIDIEVDLLRSIVFPDEHLTRRYQAGNQGKFGIIQPERIPVDGWLHVRIGEKDLRRAAFGNNR